MSNSDEEFEPIKFPIDKKTNIHVARNKNLVNVSYSIDDKEINLDLDPLSAIKFAEMIKSVADEIIDEENKWLQMIS